MAGLIPPPEPDAPGAARLWINPAHVVTAAAVVDPSREFHTLYVELKLQGLNLSRHWPPWMPSRRGSRRRPRGAVGSGYEPPAEQRCDEDNAQEVEQPRGHLRECNLLHQATIFAPRLITTMVVTTRARGSRQQTAACELRDEVSGLKQDRRAGLGFVEPTRRARRPHRPSREA